MFNFFDSDKNPFMVMMNHMAASAPDTEKTDADAGNVDALRFMQQAFTLQMQIARSMFLMPFTMIQGFAEMFDGRQETAAPAQDGFRLGKVALPPELLQMVLQVHTYLLHINRITLMLLFHLFLVFPCILHS